MLVCTKCSKAKQKKDFYRSARRSSGLAAQCRECMRAYMRSYYRKNPERWVQERKRMRQRFPRQSAAWYRANYKRRRLQRPEAVLLRSARQTAKNKGLKFMLTQDDIHIPNRCPLLGVTLMPGSGPRDPQSPSIDRINNKKGYIPNNIWVVSYRANRLKSDATLQELTKLTQNWRKHHG